MSVCVTTLDGDDNPVTVDVSDEVAAVLAELDRASAEVPFSTLAPANGVGGLAPEGVAEGDGRLPRNMGRSYPAGSAWEGPRLRFTLLLGEGRQWPIERLKDGRCGCCKGLPLARYEYCLACDRCGRELEIPSGERHRIKAYRRGKLKGGRS